MTICGSYSVDEICCARAEGIRSMTSTATETRRRSWLRDDLAYILPFAAFMACLWVGSTWKSLYPASYVARVVITAVLLVVCWPSYTKIRWNYWWLGVIVGVIGTFQWIGMQLWLQNHSGFFKPSP